jgi:hypothetical protein
MANRIFVPSFRTPLVAVHGQAGERLNFFLSVLPVGHYPKFLGHDPRGQHRKEVPEPIREIYSQIQRPTSKGRRDSIYEYLVSRLTSQRSGKGNLAAFPALSVGCQDYLEYTDIEGHPGLVTLQIGDERRFVLDGLGRSEGLLDVFEALPLLMKNFNVPLTIFAPARPDITLDTAELGQLFTDFNFRVYPVSQALAIALDQTDLHIRLTNALAQLPPISNHGGMSIIKKNPSALVAQTVLLRFVRGATEGRDFQESNKAGKAPNAHRYLTEETFDQEQEQMVAFLGDLAGRMGDKRWTDRNGVHLTSAGWQALGVIRFDIDHALTLEPLQRSEVIQKLAAIEWSRTEPNGDASEFWLKHVGLALTRNKRGEVSLASAGRSTTQAIIDYLEAATGLKSLLDLLNAPRPEGGQGATGPLLNLSA